MWHLLKQPYRGISLSARHPGRTAEHLEQQWLGHPGPERDDETSNPFGGKHLIKSVSDASWASEPDRRRLSSSVIN